MKWKDLYKVGITGSRHFPAHPDLITEWLYKYLSANWDSDFRSKIVIITGGAIGVDNAVEVMCIRQGIKNLVMPAMWQALHKIAGPARNQEIVDLSNEVLAFWDEQSPGTKDCIDRAKKANKLAQVLTPKIMMKDLGYRPTYIKVPPKIKTRDAHTIRKTVKEAKIRDLIKEAGFNPKKAKIHIDKMKPRKRK